MDEQVADVNRQIREKAAALKGDAAYENELEEAVRNRKSEK